MIDRYANCSRCPLQAVYKIVRIPSSDANTLTPSQRRCCKLLLDAGADPTQNPDPRRHSFAASIATFSQEAVSALIHCGSAPWGLHWALCKVHDPNPGPDSDLASA